MQQSSPAERNKEPIKNVLGSVLPKTGSVLEIASGTGTHIVIFSEHFPNLIWQPSDPDPNARLSATENINISGQLNILPPLNLDVQSNSWPKPSFSALVCINMIHISPWKSTTALFKHAGSSLLPGSPLLLYGPYLQSDVVTAPTNLAFDLSLKQRNSLWGLRKLDEVSKVANQHGFLLDNIVEMPANNLSVVFRLS